MQEIFEVLESRGLVSETDVPIIDSLGKKELTRLYDQLYHVIFEAQKKRATPAGGKSDVDPFTFFAGASLRGDLSCWELVCRIQKLDFLGHYAALYANEVTVPLPLSHPENIDSIDHAKNLLRPAVITLLRLRPLITGGLVKPVVMRSTHCIHTIKWVQQMTTLVHEFADKAAKELASDFEVVYQLPEKAPAKRSSVYLEGPREFLEHGNIVLTFDEDPKFRPKTWKYDREGKRELTGQRKVFFVRKIFNEIANDTTFYLAYGRFHNARLLTDRPGETFLLNSLTADEKLAATTTAMEYLTHAVPILADLPIATLLRIRRQQRDAFESYRNAITRITSDVLDRKGKLSKREARDMLQAVIEPQLSQLDKEIRSERRRQRNRVAGGLVTLAAGVAIGAFGGFPVGVTGALAGVAAVAGGRLLGKAAEVACEHGANLRQQNDLYFLLRLLKEGAQL